MREEEESERAREVGGELKRELVAVCSDLSSRSLFHSGIFGFFQSGCCSSGVGLSLIFLVLSRGGCVWGRCMSGMQTWAPRCSLGLPSACSSPWLRWSPWPAKKIPRKVSDSRPKCDCSFCPLIGFLVVTPDMFELLTGLCKNWTQKGCKNALARWY